MWSTDRIACLENISYTDVEEYANIESYNPPISISRIFGNKPIIGVMVDNGSAINIIPLGTLLALGLTVHHLKYTSMVTQSFE